MSKNNKYYNKSVPGQVDFVKEETPEVVEEVKTEEPIPEEIKETIQEEVKEEEPVKEEKKEKEAVIDGVSNLLNIRAAASTTAEVLKLVSNGEKVTVLDKNAAPDFYKISFKDKNGSDQIGFVVKKFVKLL